AINAASMETCRPWLIGLAGSSAAPPDNAPALFPCCPATAATAQGFGVPERTRVESAERAQKLLRRRHSGFARRTRCPGNNSVQGRLASGQPRVAAVRSPHQGGLVSRARRRD